jgi:hypothetical protein
MKKFIVGLLILGAVVAAVAMVMKRRSADEVDEWTSMSEDAASKIEEAAADAIEAAEDATP